VRFLRCPPSFAFGGTTCICMKKCPYCGKKYPDQATVCATDGMDLELDAATLPPPPPPKPMEKSKTVNPTEGRMATCKKCGKQYRIFDLSREMGSGMCSDCNWPTETSADTMPEASIVPPPPPPRTPMEWLSQTSLAWISTAH
jgi:hypothetical protein